MENLAINLLLPKLRSKDSALKCLGIVEILFSLIMDLILIICSPVSIDPFSFHSLCSSKHPQCSRPRPLSSMSPKQGLPYSRALSCTFCTSKRRLNPDFCTQQSRLPSICLWNLYQWSSSRLKTKNSAQPLHVLILSYCLHWCNCHFWSSFRLH